MRLDVIPERTGGAAENMAVDFLLLQRYPRPENARYRHYGWHRPSFTFGYSQKIDWVRGQLAGLEPCELCRRPTGGGVVDHRDDWTYALVIPRGHPLEEARASESYRAVHEAIAGCLRDQGVDAVLRRPDPDDAPHGPGLCGELAEVHDVVRSSDGVKIAGAAQKRNKHGLLFQGYLSRGSAGSGVDWERFAEALPQALGEMLGLEAGPAPWPEFAEGELEGLTEQYGSPEWLDYR